jgi:hypothetical protein
MSNEIRKPLAVPILQAAQHVGLSRGQFYRVFLKPGRGKAIPTGKRDRIVLVDEIEAPFDKYVMEQRRLGAVNTIGVLRQRVRSTGRP